MSHQDHKAFHKNLLSSDSAGRLIGSHTQSCATNEAGHQDIKCFLPWGGGGEGEGVINGETQSHCGAAGTLE